VNGYLNQFPLLRFGETASPISNKITNEIIKRPNPVVEFLVIVAEIRLSHCLSLATERTIESEVRLSTEPA
jgi:hypothetical protein